MSNRNAWLCLGAGLGWMVMFAIAGQPHMIIISQMFLIASFFKKETA